MDEAAGDQGQAEAWPPDDRHFDVAKAAFEQNFAQFRALNEQLNRIPAFAVTLTGGFWYVAVVAGYGNHLTPEHEQLARWGLMAFGGTCDLMLVGIAIRVRNVMAGYEESLSQFEGARWWRQEAKGRPSWMGRYSMISMYAVLMLAAGVASLAAAFVLFWPAHRPLIQGILLYVTALTGIVGLSVLLPRWLTRRR